MTDSVFNAGDKPAEAQQSEENHKEGGDLKYVGEGRKYDSPFKLDEAYGHAEAHIKKLEEDNARLRQESDAAKKMDEVLQRLNNLQDPARSTTEQVKQAEEVNKSGLSAEDVEALLAQREGASKAQANLDKVREELVGRYGEKAEERFMARSTELGLDLNQLAAQSPQAVLEFFRDAPTSATPRPTSQSSVNTQTVGQGKPGAGTFEYWQNLRREGKISAEQMTKNQWKSLSELGADAFYAKS